MNSIMSFSACAFKEMRTHGMSSYIKVPGLSVYVNENLWSPPPFLLFCTFQCESTLPERCIDGCLVVLVSRNSQYVLKPVLL
jgi:hypothetical protein